MGNAVSIVVLPLLSITLWYITAKTSYIGAEYRNRWWENGLMAVLCALAVWGAYLFVARFAKWTLVQIVYLIVDLFLTPWVYCHFTPWGEMKLASGWAFSGVRSFQ